MIICASTLLNWGLNIWILSQLDIVHWDLGAIVSFLSDMVYYRHYHLVSWLGLSSCHPYPLVLGILRNLLVRAGFVASLPMRACILVVGSWLAWAAWQ
jgi:hypothetical protein